MAHVDDNDTNKSERRERRARYKYDHRTVNLNERRKDQCSDESFRDEEKRAYVPPFKPVRMMKKVVDKSSIEYQRTTWDALKKSINGQNEEQRAYVPRFKPVRMMKKVVDKSSIEYQRTTWDALKKSIYGLVNKVNATNIKNVVKKLFAENLVRGRGLFCQSCIKSQMASPCCFTDVFAALVAVVNCKFPQVGDLFVRRVILQLRRACEINAKQQKLKAVKLIAHLVNQRVVHEFIVLEIVMLLLGKPTNDGVEVAAGLVTECGSMLQSLSPRGLCGILEHFRGILHEGKLDMRVRLQIEGLFAVSKGKFKNYPTVRPELDIVEQEDQVTHQISLQGKIDAEISLDIFNPDLRFAENEKKYEELKKRILINASEEKADSDATANSESEEEDDEQMKVTDETDRKIVKLQRTIYLTILSTFDFEEAGHKLLKIKLEPGHEMHLCNVLLKCCKRERTYSRYHGTLAQQFCRIKRIYQENFKACFIQQYSMVNRLKINELRNVAKFFAHLLATDALPWHMLAYIQLTEEDTTSSSRILIKILFEELSEQLGLSLLTERLSDPRMQYSFHSIFPKDNPKNTRFAIKFFACIGLNGVTQNLREYYNNMPRPISQGQKSVSDSESDSGPSSSNSDSEPHLKPSSYKSSDSKRDNVDAPMKRRRIS